jgi:hypothetical protein
MKTTLALLLVALPLGVVACHSTPAQASAVTAEEAMPFLPPAVGETWTYATPAARTGVYVWVIDELPNAAHPKTVLCHYTKHPNAALVGTATTPLQYARFFPTYVDPNTASPVRYRRWAQ